MQLNALRRELLQDMLASRLDAPMVAGQAYLQPYCTCDGRDLYLYLVNGSMDEASSVTLAMARSAFRGMGAHKPKRTPHDSLRRGAGRTLHL